MNALLDDLDLENTDADEVEKQIASGGAVPKAKYHARLIGSNERQAGGFDVCQLTFELLLKPYTGKEIEKPIFVSGPFKDEKAERNAKNERIHYLRILGVIQKVNSGGKSRYVAVPGKQTFNDVIGAQCILDLDVVEEQWTDKKGAERKIKKNKVDFFGIHAVDDPACKDVERAGNVAAPIANKNGMVDLDDI